MTQSFNIPETTEIQFLGYNDNDAIHLLPKGYFVKAENVFVTDNKITKVPGSSSIAAAIATQPFNGFCSFERYSAGTKYLVANINGASNAQLYSWNGSGNFSAIGTANLTNSAPMNFTVAGDLIFGFNGVEECDWDGTTYTKNRASVPLGNFAQWFHGYLWVANVSSYPNRLYWSNLGQPTSFAGGISTVTLASGGVNYAVGDALNIGLTGAAGTGGQVYVTSVSGPGLSSASDTWTTTAGWSGSYAAGFAHTSGTTAVTNDTLIPTAGYNYQITYTVTGRTAGSFTLGFGGVTSASFTASGNWVSIAVGAGVFTLTPTTDFNGTVVVNIMSNNTYGPVTGISLLKPGTGYSVTSAVATTGGSGSGATVNITAVDTTTVSSYVDVNAGDSDEITGLSMIQDELLCFKRNTIWSVAGWAADSFSSTSLTSSNLNARIFGYGATHQNSIVSVGNDVYYFSMLGSVPVIRSLKKTINAVTLAGGVVSDSISGTLADVTLSAIDKIVSTYDGRYIYWAIPTAASTTNNKIIVLDSWKINSKKGIYPFTTMVGKNVSYFANSTISAGTSTVFFTDAASTGKVFKFNNSLYTNDGTAIAIDVISRGYMGHPSRKTHWKYMYVKHDQGVDTTLHIKSKFDSATEFTEQYGKNGEPLDLNGNSPGLGPTGAFTLGVSVLGGATIGYNRINFAQQIGRIFQLQFTEESANPVTIYEYTLMGSVKGLRQ
jgi:hypothetical protein